MKLHSAGARAVLEFQQDVSTDEVRVPKIPGNCCELAHLLHMAAPLPEVTSSSIRAAAQCTLQVAQV
jgi:hypothetical protein